MAYNKLDTASYTQTTLFQKNDEDGGLELRAMFWPSAKDENHFDFGVFQQEKGEEASRPISLNAVEQATRIDLSSFFEEKTINAGALTLTLSKQQLNTVLSAFGEWADQTTPQIKPDLI